MKNPQKRKTRSHVKNIDVEIVGVKRAGKVIYPAAVTPSGKEVLSEIAVGGSGQFAYSMFRAGLPARNVHFTVAALATTSSAVRLKRQHNEKKDSDSKEEAPWRISDEWQFEKASDEREDVDSTEVAQSVGCRVLTLYLRHRDTLDAGVIPALLTKLEERLRTLTNEQSLVVVTGALPRRGAPDTKGLDANVGDLFSKLAAGLPGSFHRHILITSATALRRAGHRVREDGSTSAAVEDVCRAFREEVDKRLFTCFNDIVVRLRADAVIQLSLKQGETTNAVLHYAFTTEREEWSRFGETLHGFDCTLAISIIDALLTDHSKPIVTGISAGIKRMGHLLLKGYSEPKTNCESWFKEQWELIDARNAQRKQESINAIEIDREQIAERNRWRMLEAVCSRSPEENPPRGVDDLAVRIVSSNCDKARGDENETVTYPLKIFRLGKIQTLDREEVDSLVSMQRLMDGYARRFMQVPTLDRPLCLAVFGSPGSGKSFGVEQISANLAKRDELHLDKEPLKFNVADFTGLADLASALHRIRNRCLKGVIPVAIFDEFDADLDGRVFGWLQHFLRPMQEGVFRDGHEDFNTGDCIFVFAGGINHSFAEFSGRKRDRAFCAAKGPDFISRLRGVHNVPPLNRDNSIFPAWKIRRAILLNFFLTKTKRHISDKHLLHALLNVSAFHHGARSLEAIIEMSAPGRDGEIDLSSLPPRDQLDLHLDALEFWGLIEMALKEYAEKAAQQDVARTAAGSSPD